MLDIVVDINNKTIKERSKKDQRKIKGRSMYMLIHVRYCHRYQQQDNQRQSKKDQCTC